MQKNGIQKYSEYEGRDGNLIGYKWQGIYCIRTMPAQVRQSAATKKSAHDFGLVSSRSKIIRTYLSPWLGDPRSKFMQTGLKNTLRQTLLGQRSPGSSTLETQPLDGFSFNEAFKVNQCLHFPVSIHQVAASGIALEIPPFNPLTGISAPAGTTSLKLEAMAISFNFENKKSSFSTAERTIDYTDGMQPAATILLETTAAPADIKLVILAISYRKGSRRINRKEYFPLEVVKVIG
jgi:hypothetical protein